MARVRDMTLEPHDLARPVAAGLHKVTEGPVPPDQMHKDSMTGGRSHFHPPTGREITTSSIVPPIKPLDGDAEPG